jgi:flagellin
MSLVLNTNINSLNAQNNLSGSQASLSQALQRLSSGLRINSASDDAAGLAISQQFTCGRTEYDRRQLAEHSHLGG